MYGCNIIQCTVRSGKPQQDTETTPKRPAPAAAHAERLRIRAISKTIGRGRGRLWSLGGFENERRPRRNFAERRRRAAAGFENASFRNESQTSGWLPPRPRPPPWPPWPWPWPPSSPPWTASGAGGAARASGGAEAGGLASREIPVSGQTEIPVSGTGWVSSFSLPLTLSLPLSLSL